MKLLFSALLLSTSALAGPYDQPYSLIETDTLRSADPALQDWTPVVKQEEPMGDCMKKFKISIGK